ncbi:hypothetical protein C1645_794854 [Glomus cerebriforme]|uniref:Uncharacterized protein n=1 Tax=Glomus cerebriforme TaxID=658196 RepID=A0A397S313_9GLOM|nr:hypothetical protein C1645_795078 [Glomus cerebriforme]RIA79109.1 hypothetical protein C1645_794854 [Glomus cerebriforme]
MISIGTLFSLTIRTDQVFKKKPTLSVFTSIKQLFCTKKLLPYSRNCILKFNKLFITRRKIRGL